jgi:hypothetical protein
VKTSFLSQQTLQKAFSPEAQWTSHRELSGFMGKNKKYFLILTDDGTG